jgi:hypothetical protein
MQMGFLRTWQRLGAYIQNQPSKQKQPPKQSKTPADNPAPEN